MFEAQLAIAARKDLVRVAWVAEVHNEIEHKALLKWRETVGSSILLLIWTDKLCMLPDPDGYAFYALNTLTSISIFYIHRNSKHIYFDDFISTKPPHLTWKTSAAELGRTPATLD